MQVEILKEENAYTSLIVKKRDASGNTDLILNLVMSETSQEIYI
jgi:hypothetical protein